MKKNKMMRIASVLLIAVLLSTCVISGTFAKYVTTGETSDHARVAKFGVVIDAEGSLFANSYVNVEDGNTPGDKNADKAPFTDLTVESSNVGKEGEISQLVAPGTENTEGITFSITGTPEVDVRININFDEDSMRDVFLAASAGLPDMTTSKKNATFDLDDDYHPVVFTVTGDFVEHQWQAIKNSAGFDSLAAKEKQTSISGSMATIVSILEEVFAGEDDEGIYVDANTDLAEVFGSFTLTWKWAFDGAQKLDDVKFNAKTVDKADTLLGDLAARDFGDFTYEVYKNDGETLTDKSEAFIGLAADEEDWTAGDYNLVVSLKLTLTVTQVD
ncbi:MAG: hypothetical protein J1E00_02985 [Oscillospiraceae bacterium]|nr:hypothetical protein [Oscillospiraceae bacterium]